jgi:hypothetical protein
LLLSLTITNKNEADLIHISGKRYITKTRKIR